MAKKHAHEDEPAEEKLPKSDTSDYGEALDQPPEDELVGNIKESKPASHFKMDIEDAGDKGEPAKHPSEAEPDLSHLSASQRERLEEQMKVGRENVKKAQDELASRKGS